MPGLTAVNTAICPLDREYRERARAGRLPRIAPRRFNPEGKAWLPVLNTRFGPWHFTAHFSNTERAHDLQRACEWVVILCTDADGAEGRATVVTECHGVLGSDSPRDRRGVATTFRW